jgi:membrane protein implicated in regulation of membrane protease activity
MPWWGWIVVGAVLLGAELFVIPTDFYLVFLGTSAIAVGAVAWTGLISSSSVEWILFAALAAVSLVFFRARFARRMAVASNPRVDDTLAGERGVAREAIEPGGAGHVELRGAPWSARNVGDAALEAGARVVVERVEGLTLFVRRDS